jgi:hypothetical protein
MAGFIRSRLRPDGQGTAGAQPPPGAWSSLCEPVLVLALSHLEHDDLAAAHLVSRPWRDAARLSARELRFCRQPPDTGRIKQVGGGASGASHCSVAAGHRAHITALYM